jgi:NADH-quinone oxidoreductase subunit A
LEGSAYVPFIVYAFVAVTTVAALIVLSHIFGLKHMDRTTGEPYESGVAAIGSSRVRFDAKYYLVAMFFVIFDLEAVFVYSWAVSVREAGWAGYIEMAVFVFVLFAALVYLWKLGALEWADTGRKVGAERR